MKPILILLFIIFFPFAASAKDVTGECVADTWKNEGSVNEMFSNPWPPGIKYLLALGCVSEGELLQRSFGSTAKETDPRKVVCENGWHVIRHLMNGREDEILLRFYKDGKAVAGVFSPNTTSMSPIFYSYVFVSSDLVKVKQKQAFDTALKSKFGPAPALHTCVEEKLN